MGRDSFGSMYCRLFFGVLDDVFFVFVGHGRLGGLGVDLFVAADAQWKNQSPEADNCIDNTKSDDAGVDRVSTARASGVVRNGSRDAASSGNASADQKLFQSLFAGSGFIFTIAHGVIITDCLRFGKRNEELSTFQRGD